MIDRPVYLNQLSRAVKRSPITALVGPRQCGKTTLARLFAKDRTAAYFDLESQLDVNRLQNPQLMLSSLGGLVIIDEVQVMPRTFPHCACWLTALKTRPGFSSWEAPRRISSRMFPRPWPAESNLLNFPALIFRRRERVVLKLCGSGGDSPVLFLPVLTEIVSPGARASFRLSWLATFPSSASRFRLQPCVVSGRCWPIITVKPGMPRSSAAPSTFRTRRCAPMLDILTVNLYGTAAAAVA